MTWRSRILPVRFAMDRAGLVGADGADPCRRVRRRLSRLPAEFRGDGGGRRGRARAYGRHRGRASTTARARCAIRAARASGVELPQGGEPLPIGKGRIMREGSRDRHPVARARAWPRRCKAAEELAGVRTFDHRRRCAFRQAARPRPDSAPGARARSADHRRGGRRRAASAPCAAVALPRKARWTAA